MVLRSLARANPILAGLPLKLSTDLNLTRAQGISRRVPGLKYSHVVRDSWTRLNVLPAKIMQVCCAAYICDCGIYIVYVFNYSNRTCLLRFVRWPTRRTNNNLPNGVMYAVLSIWKLVI